MRKQTRLIPILVALASGMANVSAQEAEPVGEEFQVNTYTTSDQVKPSVAVDAVGDFVVVWDSSGSYGSDTSSYSVQGQRYDATGSPVGGQFQVNTYTTSYQRQASVAVAPDGDFVVVWDSEGSYGSDTSSYSVQGQRYDAAGDPVSAQFQVNTYTPVSQRFPSVAFEPDGDFVVVWESEGSFGTDTSYRSVQGQRYDAAGSPVGNQFQVNTYTTSLQLRASVAVDLDGDFVVVWESYGSDGSDTSSWSVQAQRYDAAGSAVGGQFQVNTYTTDSQQQASVAVDPDGNFVVAWESYGSDGSDNSAYSVQGQRFDAAGDTVGGQFQVNTYTTDSQQQASVAVDLGGDFVVAWESEGSSGSETSDWSVQGQRYDAAGSPVGGQFQVNTLTTSDQKLASVAVSPDGNFVVAWESEGSYGTDTSYRSIQGQRFATPIFTDGFESGDTSAWSSAVP